MMLEVGAVVCGFLVQSVTSFPDVGGRLWRMVYEKNGAELVWLERPDDVKTFAVAFKTLPDDDTGVAHILEHAVLQGSAKYPVKSPFDELRRSSLNVFMNAMTASDVTCYPFSSRNDQDFLNLADVYLDAVFHPTVIENPLAFRQEGWHCEIDPKTGEPFYNGIVYNEMKGARATPERVAVREVMNRLYPDTVYGRDSGGRPSAIPGLTYEKFCGFYRRHYHPSNARIFLDGRVDLPAVLKKLDAVLAPYPRAAKVPSIPMQPPVSSERTIPYASAETDRRTILADGWSVATWRDRVRRAAWEVLTDYLAGSNEAPLTRALLSEGLCDDVSLFCCDYQQVPLVLIVRNTDEAKAAACRATVQATVARLLKEGLDRARLRAIINRSEFDAREADGSRPKGLAYCLRAMGPWVYGDDPAVDFDVTGLYAELRKGVDTGLFEKCLGEAFVGNPHHVALTYVPSRTHTETEAKPVVRDRAALEREMAAFTAYQRREDSSEAKATIPVLRLADIPKSGRLVDHSIATNGAMTVFTTKATADGIAYVTAYFPADGLDAEELRLLPLLSRLFGKLPTAHHTALALETDVADRIGRLSIRTAATARGNFLTVEMAMLADRSEAAVALLKEILLTTRFEDEAAIGRILRQLCVDAERRVAARGDDLAISLAAKGLGRRWASRDLLHGYGQLRARQGTAVDGALGRHLAALAAKTIVRDGLVLSVTDNLPAAVRTALGDFPGGTGHAPVASAIAVEAGTLEGLRIDADAGYSGTAARLPDDVPYTGAMRVASLVLSRGYLHKCIREAGGAYGTGISLLPNGLITCYSYRDPTPVVSRSVVRRAGEELTAFARGDEALDRYIVAATAGMDPYRSPSEEASYPVELYLDGRTPSDLARERGEVLGTSREDLARIGAMLARQLPNARTLVVGGEKQIGSLPADRVEFVSPRR